MTVKTIATEINGLTVELQPIFGEADGAVLHMLPGGTENPEGFGGKILDVYAFTAKGKNRFRGGHYHPALHELFFTLSGTALWIFSDFREGSQSSGRTVGMIVGVDAPADAHGVPAYVTADGTLARVRVPAGVYHALFPLTDERVTTAAIGSTPYDKNDYRYPNIEDVPGALELLGRFGIRPDATSGSKSK